MKITENIIVVTDSKTYENCSGFKFFYEKGIANKLCFSYNKGEIGVTINPKEIKDCYDKDTEINFTAFLTSSFKMPECTEVMEINQDIFKNMIKREVLK